MVEIFRNSAAAGPLVDEALALPVPPKVIWMQLGVRDDRGRRAGGGGGGDGHHEPLPEDRVWPPLREIGWTGVNSRIISAKKPQMARGGVQKRTIEGRDTRKRPRQRAGALRDPV